ncbi:transposase [Bremerella sp. P1]|uniref:transposase n=1 Tax=Bremerella sp. P1 TaxID=3026424 RepID=UPI003FCE2AC9
MEARFPVAKSGGRPSSTSTHQVNNAILFLTKTELPRRMLPRDLLSWRTVYWYFFEWKSNRSLHRINGYERHSGEKLGHFNRK